MITIQDREVDPSTIDALTFERGAGKPKELVVTFKDKREVCFKVCAGHTESELVEQYDALQLALMEFQPRPG
jgi:hypothetical protein